MLENPKVTKTILFKRGNAVLMKVVACCHHGEKCQITAQAIKDAWPEEAKDKAMDPSKAYDIAHRCDFGHEPCLAVITADDVVASPKLKEDLPVSFNPRWGKNDDYDIVVEL